MKKLMLLVLLGLAVRGAAATTDPEVVALGPWSDVVANPQGLKLRGRLLICDYPAHRGDTGRETGVYLELQEHSDFAGTAAEVTCDFTPGAHGGLRCELADAAGHVVPDTSFSYGGGLPGLERIRLPSYAGIRLRASAYAAGGVQRDGSYEIRLANLQGWHLKPADTNTYFLSGMFTVAPPTNGAAPAVRGEWTGALRLPGVEISADARRPPAGR